MTDIRYLKFSIAVATVACVFFIFSFGSPYWYESRWRAHSPFVRIGLWEACFDGFVHPSDAMNKAYNGCMWIFSKEFFWIRFWLLPGWFVATQILATLAFIGAVGSYFIMLFMYLQPSKDVHRNYHKSCVILMLCAAVFQLTAILVFGIAAKEDWDWMINPVYNYYSWSYGFAIMASIFSFISCMLIYKFSKKVIWQQPSVYQYAPQTYPDRMLHPAAPPSVKTV